MPSVQSVTYATVTWDQLHRDARSLASSVMSLGTFRGLVAISRGGLIPAAIVARELECRLVESICIVTYAAESGTQGEPTVLKSPDAAGDGEGFLIVDDLVDSTPSPSAGRLPTFGWPKCRRIPGSCFPGTPRHCSSPH
jgi:xanthine phosphoribosyltransferase